MTTIKDVAKLAGVSKSTVSRVLNNGYVDEKTKEKVKAAIDELQYIPNSFARRIHTGKSDMIALIIPDSTNYFYSEIFQVVSRVAWESQYIVILCDTNRSITNEYEYVKRLYSYNIDGILYFAQEKTAESSDFFYEYAKKVPIVFMNKAFSENPDISYVSIDGGRSIKQSVEMLSGKGKKNIAFIDLPRRNNVDADRFLSYKEGLESCGLIYDEERVLVDYEGDVGDLIEEGFNAARVLLQRSSGIDAIITAADQIAVGVIRYLKSENIIIPEQVSVIGFDDIDLCTVVEPKLTTIRQPIEEIAVNATNILISKINKLAVENDRMLFPGEIIERESS